MTMPAEAKFLVLSPVMPADGTERAHDDMCRSSSPIRTLTADLAVVLRDERVLPADDTPTFSPLFISPLLRCLTIVF